MLILIAIFTVIEKIRKYSILIYNWFIDIKNRKRIRKRKELVANTDTKWKIEDCIYSQNESTDKDQVFDLHVKVTLPKGRVIRDNKKFSIPTYQLVFLPIIKKRVGEEIFYFIMDKESSQKNQHEKFVMDNSTEYFLSFQNKLNKYILLRNSNAIDESKNLLKKIIQDWDYYRPHNENIDYEESKYITSKLNNLKNINQNDFNDYIIKLKKDIENISGEELNIKYLN